MYRGFDKIKTMLRRVFGCAVCAIVSMGAMVAVAFMPNFGRVAVSANNEMAGVSPNATRTTVNQTTNKSETSEVATSLINIHNAYYDSVKNPNGIIQLDYWDSGKQKNRMTLKQSDFETGSDMRLDFGGLNTSLYGGWGGVVGQRASFTVRPASGYALALIREKQPQMSVDTQLVDANTQEPLWNDPIDDWVTGVHKTTNPITDKTNPQNPTYVPSEMSLMGRLNADIVNHGAVVMEHGKNFWINFEDDKQTTRAGNGVYTFIFRVYKTQNVQSGEENQAYDVAFKMVVKYPEPELVPYVNIRKRSSISVTKESIEQGGYVRTKVGTKSSYGIKAGDMYIQPKTTNNLAEPKFKEPLPDFLTATLSTEGDYDTITIKRKDDEEVVKGKYKITYYIEYKQSYIAATNHAGTNISGPDTIRTSTVPIEITINIAEPEPDNTLWYVLGGLGALAGIAMTWYYINRFATSLHEKDLRRRRDEQEERRRATEQNYKA